MNDTEYVNGLLKEASNETKYKCSLCGEFTTEYWNWYSNKGQGFFCENCKDIVKNIKIIKRS